MGWFAWLKYLALPHWVFGVLNVKFGLWGFYCLHVTCGLSICHCILVFRAS